MWMTKYLVVKAGVFEAALREKSESGGSSTMFTVPRDSEMSYSGSWSLKMQRSRLFRTEFP